MHEGAAPWRTPPGKAGASAPFAKGLCARLPCDSAHKAQEIPHCRIRGKPPGHPAAAGQSHSLVVGSLCALEGVERSISGLPPACRGLIGVCNRALNGISGAPPRGWEGIGRRSMTFGSGFCREAAFRDGVKSYVDVLRARASRHRRGATRSGRLRRGRGRSRR